MSSNPHNPLLAECKGCKEVLKFPRALALGFICPSCGHDEFRSYRANAVCDFCCNTHLPVTKSYPASDFESNLPLLNSVGGWASCAECARLIDSGKRDELASRSAESYVNNPESSLKGRNLNPKQINDLARTLRKAQDEFWSHRKPTNERKP